MYTGTGDGSYNPELRSYGTAVIGVKLDPKTGALKLQDYYGPPVVSRLEDPTVALSDHDPIVLDFLPLHAD